jgi:hypothetical protein
MRGALLSPLPRAAGVGGGHQPAGRGAAGRPGGAQPDQLGGGREGRAVAKRGIAGQGVAERGGMARPAGGWWGVPLRRPASWQAQRAARSGALGAEQPCTRGSACRVPAPSPGLRLCFELGLRGPSAASFPSPQVAKRVYSERGLAGFWKVRDVMCDVMSTSLYWRASGRWASRGWCACLCVGNSCLVLQRSRSRTAHPSTRNGSGAT